MHSIRIRTHQCMQAVAPLICDLQYSTNCSYNVVWKLSTHCMFKCISKMRCCATSMHCFITHCMHTHTVHYENDCEASWHSPSRGSSASSFRLVCRYCSEKLSKSVPTIASAPLHSERCMKSVELKGLMSYNVIITVIWVSRCMIITYNTQGSIY